MALMFQQRPIVLLYRHGYALDLFSCDEEMERNIFVMNTFNHRKTREDASV